jgi:putative flippase GtrA
VRQDSWRQFCEYLVTAGISYLINLAGFYLCSHVFGLSNFWATAIAVPPSTVVVFLLLNYRVFKTREA